MTDLMDRLAAANPAREDGHPPVEHVWRKIAVEADAPDRAPWRRHGGRLLLTATTAIPVLAVIVIILSAHGAGPRPSHPAVTSGRHPRSTIDPAAQRTAQDALKGRLGTIVIMNPRTGAIEAMAHAGTLRAGTPVPPGATFDVVTAAAALDSGRYGPDSLISGASPVGEAGAQVRNNQGQSLGRITLSDALTFSVNTVFARVGTNLGRVALADAMRGFRFYLAPGVPGVPASGARDAGRLVPATDRRVALAPLAAGQGSVMVTPLQLAMEAAAVANGGWLPVPHARTLAGPTPHWPVLLTRTARTLTQMLRRVVTHGTATAAGVPGVSVAGLTGTAPAGGPNSRATVASFIGFAPASHPTVAIAVVVTDGHGGYGGTEAAPIAGRILRQLLRAHR
jgi:peptidoglycan glycosyltransferase